MRVNKMAKLTTVAVQEGFIVQMNGDYNLPFDEVELEADVVAGEYIEGVGIAAKAGKAGEFARVMVRGNPTTVDYQALDLGEDEEAAIAALAEVGIIVVNQ